MMYKYKDKIVYTECNCGDKAEKNLADFTLEFLEEFGQYENLNLECKECGLLEIYNLNIPSEEEDYLPDWVSQEERNQRNILRAIRKDFE